MLAAPLEFLFERAEVSERASRFPSLSPPPPPRRYVCPSPRQMPTGRGLCSLLGTRPGTSNGVQSTSVLFSSCTLAAFRASDENNVSLHLRANTYVQNVAVLKLLQIPNFFTDYMYCSPLMLEENYDSKKLVCSNNKKVFIPMLSSTQWTLGLAQRSGAL